VIHSLHLASFRYVTNEGDRKCFSSVLACTREDLRLSPATRELSSSLSIFILPWSRVSQASAVRRGPPVVSRNSSYDAWRKCRERFRITLKTISSKGSEKCHFYANKSLFNYFTWYATFIKSFLLAFSTPSFSWLDFSILHNRRRFLFAYFASLSQ